MKIEPLDLKFYQEIDHESSQPEMIKAHTVLLLNLAIERKAESLKFETKDCRIIFNLGSEQYHFPPPPGFLYEKSIGVILAAAQIAYWSKGSVSAELETKNPFSRWIIESQDLSKGISLKKAT